MEREEVLRCPFCDRILCWINNTLLCNSCDWEIVYDMNVKWKDVHECFEKRRKENE